MELLLSLHRVTLLSDRLRNYIEEKKENTLTMISLSQNYSSDILKSMLVCFGVDSWDEKIAGLQYFSYLDILI